MNTNPLLDFSGLPRFDEIRPEHVTPAIDALLADADAAVKAAETVTPVRWETFITPLDDATERLYRAWGQVAHLQAVVNTPELREVYNANLSKISRFGSALAQNPALYAQYKALAASPDAAGFDEARSKGVAIPGKPGDPVYAAADGRVVYAGSGLRGYGNLVIIKHNATYLTAYAHNQTLLVKEDQTVKKGQKIAEMGSTDADRVKLHFEIRRSGKPVDPSRYLPSR